MGIITNCRDYFLSDELEINVLENKVNIINYISIDNFSTTNVTVKHKSGSVKISGNNLVINKLLKDEVLIIGQIKNIEFR